jgi:hypothetical protein
MGDSSNYCERQFMTGGAEGQAEQQSQLIRKAQRGGTAETLVFANLAATLNQILIGMTM